MSRSGPIGGFMHLRWRVLASAVLGALIGAGGARAGAPPGASILLGWTSGAGLYVLATLWLIFTSAPQAVRDRASREDEDPLVLTLLVLVAVALSFGGIIVALKEAKAAAHGAGSLGLGLSAATLVLSWLVVQCLYTLRYAHRYFGDRDGDGVADAGILFPGAAPTTYRDFFYVSVCIGATCQVSDFNITTARFRNLVTSQALISFTFNTLVLALGINIIGNLLGQ